MLHCPVRLHRIHRFRIAEQFYVADIDKRQCFEISELADEILQRCESMPHEELIEGLCERFPHPEVMETMEELGKIAELGFLFQDTTTSPCTSDQKPRIQGRRTGRFRPSQL